MTGADERTGSFTYHGGRLAAARAAFPDAPEPWIDLSTGINGRPYPIGGLDSSSFERLPEAAALGRLEAAAARAYGADPSNVIAAPGTQALIQWLPRLFPARRVGILGFTYAEHARVWGRGGATVETVDDLTALDRVDAAIVVNPNNPEGRRIAPDRLAALAARVGLLIVDESFMDVLPADASLVPILPEPRTIVLRSFGKTYGLAGLRLGFAIASADAVATLREALGPWAVSGPAIDIGRRALDDRDWLAASVARLEGDAVRLDALLVAAGAEIVGGTPLFRLARVPGGPRWFERLAHAGILVRPFAERPDWLRLGLPAHEWQWARLAEALAERP